MKKFLKVLGILLLLIILLGVGAVTYITTALPDIDAPADLKVEPTPERIERGRYLANSVCVCMDCHSTRDWNTYAAPMVPGTLGKGGERFDETMNFPGTFFSRNITPAGVGSWSDGELYRAMTSGISKDGHPFFPVMPYPNYNKLATEDVYSIIAYLRSVPAIENQVAESRAVFPVSVILHTVPSRPAPTERPAASDILALGAYLTNAAGCGECHTKMEKGEKVGEPFAGGFEFVFPNGSLLRSPNITPSEDGGIGRWTKEQFIQRFKMYADSGYVAPPVDWARGDMQTAMPWMMYASMTEEDLGAIYSYLRTVKPVDGMIEKWTPAGS
ncbi:MAG: c-type cytochrome [Flavobacteriales bacterium]|nr:c-type cytochrome [Flavobacteriales bacterium]